MKGELFTVVFERQRWWEKGHKEKSISTETFAQGYLICPDFSLPSGGLAAVIYTDTLQTFIMVVGSIILTGFGK